MIELVMLISLFSVTIWYSAPLVLASLGETVVERGGILNLGIEGAMLMGAFSGFMGAYLTGNLWIGLLTSIVAGLITVLIFGFFVIRMNLDQVVSGLAINLMATGLCLYFFRLYFSEGQLPYLASLITPYPIPWLSQIPVVGNILFNQSIFVYIGFIATPLIFYLIFKTSFGLRLRSIGEDPAIASYLGINVSRTRVLSLIIEGIFVGMAGGSLRYPCSTPSIRA